MAAKGPDAIATDPQDGGNFDLSPVDAPGEIVLHVRWKNASATLGQIAAFGKLPKDFVDSQIREGLKEIFQDELRDLVDPAAFAEAVAIDAPLDVIVAVDTSKLGPLPEPMGALSVGLSSLRQARGAVRGRLESMGPGLWKLTGGKPWGPKCVIAASVGKAPARLICADDFKQLQAIAPFVARTLPTRPAAASDVRFDLSLRPLLDKYGRTLRDQAKGLPKLAQEGRIGVPKFDDALMDAALAISKEAGALIDDVDGITIDLSVDAQKGVTLAGAVRFTGKQSWLAQTAVDGAHLAGPAPDIFWRAPLESHTVGFARGGDPSRLDGILETGAAMLEGVMEEEGFATPADRRAIAQLLRIPMGKYVPSVTATGHFPSRVDMNNPDPIKMIEDSIGWYLVGVEDSPAKLKGWLTDAMTTYNRRSLQSLLKQEMRSDAKHLPVIKKVTAPAALGAGAMAIEITIPDVEHPSDSNKTVNIKAHILVMQDGSRTWAGLAMDRDKLAQLMVSTKGSKTIAARGDLSSFRSEKVTSGGYFTFDTLIEAAKPAVMLFTVQEPGSNDAKQADKFMKLLEQLPHKGKTPVLMLGNAVDGSKPQVRFSFTVQRETLEDAGWLADKVIKHFNP